ncbi:hypothetical protein CTDIVETGP_0009 [Clostridium tyrobutyricum DIVETGP]|uniref:Uncharacterized protein n=1 Tax=Clostridium tyrobutyricum DIVETGP TaxID=1408889 RepID=W6N4B8_CLOTY|nr:hypothetical protein CTDIVETGP_0009 [Clostridium tyrobutyricum DIVETGP]
MSIFLSYKYIVNAITFKLKEALYYLKCLSHINYNYFL